LEKAGWVLSASKGFASKNVSMIKDPFSGVGLGDDAHHYQEKDVRKGLQDAK
jgi:hypothetical protein